MISLLCSGFFFVMGVSNIRNGKKVCNKCYQEKSVSFFSKRHLKSGVLSYNNWCKDCRSIDDKIKRRKVEYNICKVDNQDGEVWESVIGYEGYCISNYGRVKSLIKSNRLFEALIYPKLQKHGYYSIPLYPIKGKSKRFSIHRLVAIHFIPNPENKKCVNHIDNDRTNNKIWNLEWCTHAENMEHAKKCRRMQYGINRHNNALTEKQVLEIFNSKMEQRPLAKLYNVNQGTVAKIKTGENWGHLTGKIYIKKQYARNRKCDLVAAQG